MKRAAVLIVAFALAAGGLGLAVSAEHRAIVARRNLVSELSATLGRARTVDTIAQQVRAEQGRARPAADLLRESLVAPRNRQEREALESALGCVLDGGCPDPTAPLAAAQATYVSAVDELWKEVDAAEGALRLSLILGLVLVLLGVVAAAVAPRHREAAPPPGTEPPDTEPPGEDQRQLEDMLRQRLEALYQARSQLGESARFGAFGELAAALSHGLKTPLAGVLASTQLAQLKLGEANPAKDELDEVVRLTEGLTEQVQRFLRAAGQVSPARQRVRVGDLVAQLDAAYTESSRRRGVTFTTRAASPDLELDIDAALLEMALKNLVENALAAVKGGQAVAVTVAPCAAPARVGLDGAPPAQGAAFVELVVDDQGPGLPVAARRGEPGVTTRAAGSGLGLAIARRVAERHGGALMMEDRPGGGARVRLVLPQPQGGPA